MKFMIIHATLPLVMHSLIQFTIGNNMFRHDSIVVLDLMLASSKLRLIN